MTNFACMDNMFDFDLTVDKGCSVDQSDLMAWFDQSPLIMPQQEERGYNGLFSSCFLEATTSSPSMELKETQNLLLHEQQEEDRLSPTTAAATSPAQQSAPLHDHVPKYKKRRNQQKRVVQHVKAEDISSDLWAWRKYGQKPIKGSSFPRSYYRCSSSKGCIARKLVERSNSDPGTFIVTYTGDHTHSHPTRRSSLAGSTRTSTKTPSPSTRPKQQTLAEEVAEQQLPKIDNNTNQIQDLVFSEEIDEMVIGWGELEMADQWPWILP